MNLPVRPPLNRTALERVLARAAELQGQTPTTDETVGALTDEQILELGKEVGLTPESLRQAIAEERARVTVPEEQGAAGWLGGSGIGATRVVPGAAEAVLASIDGTMRNDLPFDVERRFPDRMQWAPSRSVIDAVRSSLSGTNEGYDLRLAEGISAAVVAVDAQRTHVRLDATLEDARRRALRRTVLWPSLFAALTAPFVISGDLSFGLAALLTLAVGGAFAFWMRTSYRRRVLRVATALEQLLDRLEFGPARKPKGFFEKLLG